MLKVFATQVVISRGYDGAAAIKFSEKGDAVRFRIGKKVYDPNAENNARWVNMAVKGFGPICERSSRMDPLSILSAVWTRMSGKTSRLTRRKAQWSSFWMILSMLPAEVSLRITRTPMKRKDIRQQRRHRQRPHPQITAAALPATSRLAEAIPSSTKTERQQLNRAYKRRT